MLTPTYMDSHQANSNHRLYYLRHFILEVHITQYNFKMDEDNVHFYGYRHCQPRAFFPSQNVF